MARATVLVSLVSMDLFIDELMRGMALLGIKGEKIPSNADMVNMYKSVMEEYKNIKIGEVALAFDLASKGKLDMDAETYQNFSMLYLHRILRAFARFSIA
jgi:hypothetical protein